MSVISEVATYLQARGIGTLGTDLFYSYVPDAGDNLVSILDTGGLKPDEDLPIKEPTFQVFVRAQDYTTGKAKLDAIRALLHQKEGTTLNSQSTFFYFIFAISEGGHIGRNERGQDEFSMNFRARTR